MKYFGGVDWYHVTMIVAAIMLGVLLMLSVGFMSKGPRFSSVDFDLMCEAINESLPRPIDCQCYMRARVTPTAPEDCRRN